MACEIITIDGRSVGIICGRNIRHTKCKFCGAACTKECDYPSSKRSGTCDAKLCDRCATSGGAELDYCPTHAPFVFPMAGHSIIVASLRTIKEGIRIDRGYSDLANPFKLKDESRRPECLEQYRQWLWKQINQPKSRELIELRRLAQLVREQDVTLLCWCAPKGICHGQIVAKAVNWLLEQTGEMK